MKSILLAIAAITLASSVYAAPAQMNTSVAYNTPSTQAHMIDDQDDQDGDQAAISNDDDSAAAQSDDDSANTDMSDNTDTDSNSSDE